MGILATEIKTNNMSQVKQEDIEVLISNAEKPLALSNFSYPLNSIADRIFETLTYSLFKKRIETNDSNLTDHFDDIKLMQGVGEKGMDCILLKNNTISGVIQCKKYSKNISDLIIMQELIKFTLHFINDEKRFTEAENFKYFISTSTGYTGKAISLFENINNVTNLKESYDFYSIIDTTIKKYKSLGHINIDDVINKVPELISSFKYESVGPDNYNLWINNYSEIIETFFEIKKVTDNVLIEKKGNEILEKIEIALSNNDKESITKFINIYKETAKEKLNVVNFIGFDLHRYRQKPTDIELTDLFVQPSFIQRIDDKNTKSQSVLNRELKITNVLKSDKNIMILGEPGAGKSLLVKYIMVQILLQNEEKLGIKQFSEAIPFRIELRKYNEHRDSKNIIEYLSDVLSCEYQTEISAQLLTKIIKNQKTIIFFDGLDEIFNISHKNKMKESIETFSNIYQNSKCIVTSRFIGYHDIKFNSKNFDEFAILRFGQPQVEELVHKFYTSQIQNNEKRKTATENCLSQIKNDIDTELKSNPLILTLILILASNNIVIPDSKLEIYEACTNTLVESIDSKEKELKFEMPVKNKRSTFAHLAYWQYEAMSKNNIVSFEKTIKTIADFLVDKKEVIEYSEAEEKSKKFLEYAERRSIYFENNFTHKTFLEYFTADYLFINYFTKASDISRKKLISIITTYLPNSFWYIVFELLFSKIDKLQADNEVLDEILNNQIESNSINVFYFFISNISKFSNISTEVKKEIIKKTIRLCVKGEKVTEIRRGFNFEENSLISKLNQLQKNEEDFNILQEAIYEIENSKLSEKDAIEFYNLFHEISSLNSRQKISRTLKINNSEKLEKLAYKDLLLFSQVYVTGYSKEKTLNISILINQLENFGTKSIFKDVPFKFREFTTRIDTFDLYLLSVIEQCDVETFKRDYKILIENGVKHSNMVEHAKKNRLHFYHRGDGFEKVLKLYINSNDKQIDELLICLVKKDVEMKNAYIKFKSTNKSPKLKRIDKIFEI